MALFERECQPEALGDDSEDVDMLRQKAREALLAGRAWGLRGFRARGGGLWAPMVGLRGMLAEIFHPCFHASPSPVKSERSTFQVT